MPYRDSSFRSYLFIIIATVLLYLWQLHLYPMINTDGVTYIEGAAAFVQGGLHATLAIDDQARWPFYSIMIATVHYITHLSIASSEHVLDGILICFLASLFLFVVRLFSQHKYASFWAIVAWLTWHAYAKWWPVVMRDNGFLVFLLLSFYCYYRYIMKPRFIWALAWSLCMMLAELFRIEAAIYILIVPFSVFFLRDITWPRRLLLWLKLNILVAIAAVCVVALFVTKVFTLDSFRFAYMWQELSRYFLTLTDEFMRRNAMTHYHIFYRENPYSVYGLIAGYIAVFVCYVIGHVSFAALLPMLFMRRVLDKLNQAMLKPVFFSYFVLVLAIPLLFFMEYVFLNGRYLLPLGLFVLLFTASILPHVIDSFQGKKKCIFVVLACLLFLINLIGSLIPFGHRTQDELDAGLWLKKHYPNLTIFTNAKRILFYDSEAPDYKNGAIHEMWTNGKLETGSIWLGANDDWCSYNLLVLSSPAKKTAAESQMFLDLQREGALGPVIKRFTRKSNGEDIIIARIYRHGCMAFVHRVDKK